MGYVTACGGRDHSRCKQRIEWSLLPGVSVLPLPSNFVLAQVQLRASHPGSAHTLLGSSRPSLLDASVLYVEVVPESSGSLPGYPGNTHPVAC